MTDMNEVNDYQLIQSAEILRETCTPKFSYKIFPDLKWEASHNYTKCSVESLWRNRIFIGGLELQEETCKQHAWSWKRKTNVTLLPIWKTCYNVFLFNDLTFNKSANPLTPGGNKKVTNT